MYIEVLVTDAQRLKDIHSILLRQKNFWKPLNSRPPKAVSLLKLRTG